ACFTACGVAGGVSANSSTSEAATSKVAPPVTGNSVDPLFTEPYVDVDEWQDMPVRHRHVHGGFKGEETRFSVYFRSKEQWTARCPTSRMATTLCPTTSR